MNDDKENETKEEKEKTQKVEVTNVDISFDNAFNLTAKFFFDFFSFFDPARFSRGSSFFDIFPYYRLKKKTYLG